MRTIAATGQVLIHQPLDFNANGAAAVKSFLSGADFAIQGDGHEGFAAF